MRKKRIWQAVMSLIKIATTRMRIIFKMMSKIRI